MILSLRVQMCIHLYKLAGLTAHRYRERVGWMIKFVEFECYIFIGLWTVVPLIAIRIPPFLGYCICHSMYHIFSKDLCSLTEPDYSPNLYYFMIVNVLRLANGTVSALFSTSFCWEAIQMLIYEVFLSLVFFSSCLKRIQIQMMNADVLRFQRIWPKYVQLQLLNQVFNSIYQTGVFGVWVTAVILLAILSGSLLLKISQESILLALFAFAIVIVCYICLGVFLSFASHIWIGSEKINTSWKKNPQLMKNPVTRRVRMSVRNMKIKIGSVNFIERLTPLVVLSFCVEQTVTLILLGN
jgi:hypothetical protein